MSIGLKGIRMKSMSFSRDDKGQPKVQGTYELVGTNDRVLASQTFNQYGGMDIPHSPATVQAIDAMTRHIEGDVSALLGMEVVQ